MPNKIPWSLPLYRIVKNPVLSPLKDLLVQDGILTPTFIEHCNRVLPEDFATVAPNRVIYGLRQSFPIHGILIRGRRIIEVPQWRNLIISPAGDTSYE
ncbi:hypothetical protein LENED_010263 [Lentinula edodes]|uniref:Uncharacterized protein n=1 Tax=Lentinula edodes TaxID=5353 RepID=A0A1Q3ELZ8_LENED|nr:hypothetical protein LENED_010263 [Lentinula edodes]